MGEKHSEEEWLQNSSFWKLEWARASQDGGGCGLLGVSCHVFFSHYRSHFLLCPHLSSLTVFSNK